jgi:hypothetical protein
MFSFGSKRYKLIKKYMREKEVLVAIANSCYIMILINNYGFEEGVNSKFSTHK